MVIASAIKIKR